MFRAFFIFICLISSASAETYRKPKFFVENPIYDFGTVHEGAKVEANFVVKNLGEGPLIIEKLVAGCGCTASTATKGAILPGKQGKINLTFDTSGFSGEKLKSVRVYTNDPDAPTSMVSIQGVVEVDLKVDPPRVFFGDVSKGLEHKQEVTLSIRQGAALRLGEIKIASPFLSIDSTPNAQEKEAATGFNKKLSVKLSPEAPIGEFRDRIVIALSNTKRQNINIPVFANIQGPLELEPESIAFGVVEQAKKTKLTRKLKLINKSKEALKILKITSNSPAISASLKNIEKNNILKSNNYIIDVNLNPSLLKSNLKAQVSILTDNKDQPEIVFNVFAVLAPSVK